jgi:hypothetical protein
VSPSTLSRLGQGRKPDVDGLAALAAWSGLDIREFVRGSRRLLERPDTLAAISSSLHSDPRLSPAHAAALDDMVKAAYARLKS